MDKYTIGNNAGIVWKLLNNGKRWSYEDLKKASGLTDRDLNAAIGWLAREDKVYFETDKNSTEFLYLSVNVYY
ncbi:MULTISPECIES: winged helix-turn-helix domain-containing protein [Bacteroidaceae]|uniref:Winged helix-turn-helix domain-containing protein n=2 Tax=Bacteroidaceae TaxID=815 RepID=A0AA41D9Y4_9BACT|nr:MULTISPECIES: winged helix-turn-helix domain-containing protein [Bacteroidaceae]MBM6858121.1 winged helix-turn-helix domain-containing protein [Caecibacteroides pullorum]MBV8059167.1 winged helix-turn-helix domain-containing protein [Caecibacteroides pullorum]HIZ91405.1 winged helix-turn-helix domain-containing protein [Candidatus Bacteroides merdavium]